MARLSVLLPALTGLAAAVTGAVDQAKRPNVVFILTDDQDVHMNSLDYMPLLHKYILNEGTQFDRHYCTVSVCCPSRVNIWTGLAAHTSNVTDLFPPYGGYPKFVKEGLNEKWLPVFLQELGYQTYYSGKLFNAHSVDNYDDPHVKGFNGSDFLLDPYTYEYYNARMTRNGAEPVSYEGQYSPDVVAAKAYGFLDEAALQPHQPFFLGIAPIAPHSNARFLPPAGTDVPRYAPRHAHLFKDYKIPRTANFNPNHPSGVSWVKNLPQLNQTVVDYLDEFQRSRLRALQAVDEMIEVVVSKLSHMGVLDNTYILYSTDNGYHIGQHRMPPGKECPYETDINVPLAIRGPGVPAGHVAGVVSSHTDLTPTILKIAGSDRPDLDGSPLPLTKEHLEAPSSGEHVNVEFWGRAIPEGIYGKIGNDTIPQIGGLPNAAGNNTYKALRVVGEGYNFLYTVWCTGESELYDLIRDPDQLVNYLNPKSAVDLNSFRLAGREFNHVVARLDSLLMVLKSCRAASCRDPWKSLHPDGSVNNLRGALRSTFDTFYQDQPKVSFSSCELGYLIEAEGPQHVNSWKNGEEFAAPARGSKQQSFQYVGHWAEWT